MRTVKLDEVYNLNGERVDPVVDFKCHVPKKYKVLVDAIQHVDTRLRKREDGTLYWRVQGYLELDDLEYLLNSISETPESMQIQQDMMIGFSKGKLEIWALSVDYYEEPLPPTQEDMDDAVQLYKNYRHKGL